MEIEVYYPLNKIDFKTNKTAISNLSFASIIDTSRDCSYTVNVNSLREGIFELTIYIIHQEQSTSTILVSYVATVKSFLIGLSDITNDKLDLFKFIESNMEDAYKYVCINEPNIKVNLKKQLKTAELCDKIIESLKKLGFYK